MIKFGVIGCGNVAPTYLYSLTKNKHAQVMAVVDVDTTITKKIADTYGIRKIYQDYKEMLPNEDLDAVVICTPHFVHYEQVLYCAERKLAILCEKPLSVNMVEIEEMIEKCWDIHFSVMLQRRFYPNSIATAQAVQMGVLGEIKEASLKFTCHKTPEFYDSWRGKKISGGGVLISQALHRIDQLSYFFGEALAVEGIVKKTRDEIEVEDYAKGRIYFPNGVVADIEADNFSGNPETISIIEIVGSRGRVCLSDDKTIAWSVDKIPKPAEVDINMIPTSHRPAYYGPCHERLIDDFVDSLVYHRPLTVTGKDALPSMKIIFGFYESARKGKKIFL